MLARAYSSEQRVALDALLDAVPSFGKHHARAILDKVTTDVDQICRRLDPTLPLSFFVEFVENAPIQSDLFLYLPKWQLKHFFLGWERNLPGMEIYPEHTLVSIDLHGIHPHGYPGEVRILEAALFEDMCTLFNRAWDLTPQARDRSTPKMLLKECAATRRASVLAAFYVVEAYLNSIAFDYFISLGDDDPSPELEKIAEWDYTKGRVRLVSLRDKLIHYPKIVARAKHPLLDENNCAELKYFLEVSKLFRDAVVHAGPRPDPHTYENTKEILF